VVQNIFAKQQLEESCEHFFEPFESVGKMIGPLKTSDFCRYFYFCDDREKSEKGNNFSFKKRSIHSLSRTLFKQTDFVEISGCFCFWCRAQIGRALRKEREEERRLNFT